MKTTLGDQLTNHRAKIQTQACPVPMLYFYFIHQETSFCVRTGWFVFDPAYTGTRAKTPLLGFHYPILRVLTVVFTVFLKIV